MLPDTLPGLYWAIAEIILTNFVAYVCELLAKFDSFASKPPLGLIHFVKIFSAICLEKWVKFLSYCFDVFSSTG